jgi:fido (protein-threonine AMPylation protein)
MAKAISKNTGRGRGRSSLSQVLQLLDEEVSLLKTTMGGLPRAVEADSILREIWIDDVHNSTAIEGNTMTRAQVAALVERGQASASLLETLEVDGYAAAADWIYRSAADYEGVPMAVVSEAHRRAVELVWAKQPPGTRDQPGAWRKSPVRVARVVVSVPAAIPADLESWGDSTADLKGAHPVVHAAIHHAWFERIHPFVDGNGRVGRLILNFMLLQHGYPPAVILKAQRSRYLQGLALADGGSPNALAEVIARAVSGTLTRFLMPALAGEAKLVPLSTLAARGPYPVEYLRLLVFEGKLKAVPHGNLWLSSRKWLRHYISSRDPRGRARATKRRK